MTDTRTRREYGTCPHYMYFHLEDCGRGSIPPSHPHTTMSLPPLVTHGVRAQLTACSYPGMAEIFWDSCAAKHPTIRGRPSFPPALCWPLPYRRAGLWYSTPHSRSVRGSGSGRPCANLSTHALGCCVERERLRPSPTPRSIHRSCNGASTA